MNYPDAFILLPFLEVRHPDDVQLALKLLPYLTGKPAPATVGQMVLWAQPSGVPLDTMLRFFSQLRPFYWPPAWFEACLSSHPTHIRATVLRARYGDNACSEEDERAWMRALGYTQVLRGGVMRYVR